jgi:flagellar hook-length control protein FliK
LEITPFHIKQVNQTHQNERKNKLAASESNNDFGHLIANYLSKGPNNELGTLNKENAAEIDLKVEEQNGPVMRIPLPSDLIQTVDTYSPNLEEEEGLITEDDNQTGLELLNLVSNQLVYQNSESNHLEGSNFSRNESVKSLVDTQAVIQSENDSIPKQNTASPEIPTGVLQNPNASPNISLQVEQPEDYKNPVQESTPLVRNDSPLFGNDLAGNGLKDNPTEQVQNISYTTISKILNQKDTSSDSRNNEFPLEENKGLLLDKSQLIGHQPIPFQVNNSSKVSNVQSLPSSIHINDFVPELQKWMSNIKIINDNPGTTEAKVSLFPKNLGHIEIKIITVDGQLSAEIMTDTLLAKEVLEGQLPQLKQSLQLSGLVVQKLEIFQQPVNQVNDLNQANLSFSHSGTSFSNEQRSNNTKQASSNKGKKVESTELGDEILLYGNTRRNSVSNIDFTA